MACRRCRSERFWTGPSRPRGGNPIFKEQAMKWLLKLFGDARTVLSVDEKPDPMSVAIATAPGELDVFGVTIEVLASIGHAVERRGDHLLHTSSGICLVPQLRESLVMESGNVRSASQVDLQHPAFGTGSIVEYQYAIADTLEDAFHAALLSWAKMDFVVLLDALLPKALHSTVMLMTFPSKNQIGERRRRILLGPVAHRRVAQSDAQRPELAPGEHDFCPCCMLTKNYDAFQNLFNDGEFHAVRLFASRDNDGSSSADCRVNGENFEQGEASLRRYAGSWPQHGLEYRKQCVVIQDCPQVAVKVEAGADG
jgi:hypothetical protein